MKLRTRLMIISCSAIFLASVISGTVVLAYYRSHTLNQAIDEAVKKSTQEDNEIEKRRELLDLSEIENKNNIIRYILKEIDNPYVICFYEFGEIYNHTNITMDDIKKVDFKDYGNYSYGYADYGRSNYLIIKSSVYPYTLYRLFDITNVKDRIRVLTIVMIATVLAASLFVCAMLFLLLKKSFEPMDELCEAVDAVAKGDYEQQIKPLKYTDINRLAESVNNMSKAIGESTDELKSLEQEKTLLLGSLSHELKTPMTAISGYAQTLLFTKISEEEKQEALEYIYKECNRLSGLSAKMTELISLEKSQNITMKEHSVRELFEMTANSLRRRLKEKDITLSTKENGESIYMDIDLMEQALINLIDNAIKASDKGAYIHLYTSSDERGSYIAVKDCGKGIAKEELDRITEPFYMVDKSRSRKDNGAGLGLAIVKLIVLKHDFRLLFESEVGKGLEVRIYNTFTI